MLYKTLPPFQVPALTTIAFGMYAIYATGQVASIEMVCVRVGKAVEWGEPLLEVLSDGMLEESVTAPASGIVRWVHPHLGNVRNGSPVALLELDKPRQSLHTGKVVMPRPTLPHPAPLPSTPLTAPLTTAILPATRRSTMKLPVELEMIESPPPLPFPYNLADKTKRRTFHLPEAGGIWADGESDRLKVNVSHLIQAMIYHFATLTPAQRGKVLKTWQQKWREGQ